jgi:hypothetical protein
MAPPKGGAIGEWRLLACFRSGTTPRPQQAEKDDTSGVILLSLGA